MIALLSRLVQRAVRPSLAYFTFTIYSRKDCGCCHSAMEILKESQRQHGFSIDEIDIDTDASLVEKYGLEVPVVTLNGKVRFKGKINPVLLDRLLLADRRGD